MLTQQVLKKVVSSILAIAIMLTLLNPLGLTVTKAYAMPGDELGLFEVNVNKPVNAIVDVPNAAIGISLPYGASYQMLNVTTNPGVTAAVYRSDETTVIPFAVSNINPGDAKLDQFSPNGTSLYYLVLTDINDSSSSRKYTITVTVDMELPASIANAMGPNDKYSPLNIKAGEHAWDVLGASKIGFGSTTGSIEGPGKASSYSGKDWFESVYDRSGDYPAAQTVPDSWLGDNMYLQPIGKTDMNALTKYGIENSAGLDKLGSDILRFHEFAPFKTPEGVSRDDGDRGAVNSDRQRLEIKSNTSSSNIDANSVGGDIMTHHWKLMLPSETIKYQMDAAQKEAGDFIAPRRFFHIFQLKAIEGNEAGQPVTTLTVVSVDGKGYLEFRNNPDGEAADRIKPLFTIPLEQVVDRWLDMEVTILSADKGYVYGKLVDVATNAVLSSGGMTAETLRRPEVLNPVTGKKERADLPAVAGQQNRSKWGLYRGMYNTVNESVYADEFQAATMYLSDIYLIKRDASTYVFPDGWNPNSQPKDIVAWARPNVVSGVPGTVFDNLDLPAQLDVTLSTGKIEKVNVIWSPEGYSSEGTGNYRIYGEFNGTGIMNTANIRPYVDVNISGIKNWAVAPGAEIKVVSQSGGSKNNFIDGQPDTSWQAHSSLAKTEGYQYWAAVKLEKKIKISQIQLEWTSNSKFLKNYQLYYTNDAAAYDELMEGTTLSATSSATRKPLLTEHGSAWTMIPGAGKATDLSNNEKADLTLNESVDAQYVLLVADLTLDNNAGGIKSNVFNIIGTPVTIPTAPGPINLLDPSRFTPQAGVNLKVSSEHPEHPGTDALKSGGAGYWRNSSSNVYKENYAPSSLALSLDLGTPKTVDKLYLEIPNAIANIQKNATRFEVYYSNDPQSWASAPTASDTANHYDWEGNGWRLAGGTETEGMWSNVTYNGRQWGFDTKSFLYPFTARYVMINTVLVGPRDRRADENLSAMGLSGLAIYGKDPISNATTLTPSKAVYSTWDQTEPISTTVSLAGGQTVKEITDSQGKKLILNTDYRLTGNTVSLEPSFLAKLPLGTNELIFHFNNGSPSVFALDVTARGHGENSKTIKMNAIGGVSPYNVLGGAMGTDEPVEGVTKRIRDAYHAYYGDRPEATLADDHIQNVWDSTLQRNVFKVMAQGRGLNNEFEDKVRDGEYAHKGVFDWEKGYVVGGAAINDRQRIEIRPSEDSTKDFTAYEGDIVAYQWLWNIPDGNQWNQPNFRHIFQLKATNAQAADTLAGGNSAGENGAYILAMSITGKDTRELIINHNRYDGDKTLLRIPLKEIGSHWIKVELNALISDSGWLTIKITDTVTGKVYTFDSPDVYQVFPKQGEGDGVKDLWRRPERTVKVGSSNVNFETEYPAAFDQYLRPKWGIYRSSNGTTNSAYDAELQLADITISKLASGVSSANLARNKKAYNVGSTEGANALQLASVHANVYGNANKLTNGVLEDPIVRDVTNITSLDQLGNYVWLGTDGARKGSFVLDLGQAMDFSQIRLFAKSTRLKGAIVSVSDDFSDHNSAAELDAMTFKQTDLRTTEGYTYATGNLDGGNETTDASYPINLGRTYHSRYIKITVENASGGHTGTDLTGPPRLTQVQVFNAPMPPQNLKIAGDGSSAVLKWDANDQSEGYTVYNGQAIVAELPAGSTGFVLPAELSGATSISVRSKGTDPYSRKFMISAPAFPVLSAVNPGSGDSKDTPASPGSATAPAPSNSTNTNPGRIDLAKDAIVTKETAADGSTVIKVVVDPQKLEKALANPAVLIEVKGTDPAVHVELSGNALLQAIDKQSHLIIQMNGIRYELPVTLFADIQKDSVVNVSITKVTGKAAADVNGAVKSQNAKQVIADPIEFTITVNGSEMLDFGGVYVDRTMMLDQAAINPAYLTAVWVDSHNQLHFVPAVIMTKDGSTEITIRSPHNSVYTVIQSEKSFSDLQGHWAQADIELLANKWILNGMTDRQFVPEANVTRAEFAAMLVRSLGLAETKDNTFQDVPAADWFAGAVGAAYKAGLINGYEDGTFQPNALITREQMITMMMRAMKAGGKDIQADRSALSRFADHTVIGEWSKDAVSQALKAGLIQGMSDTEFAALEPATRAQAAVMLRRALQSLQFIN
ncbi:S-layer homology domain-containing protein [Bacillus sp. 3255]|uniref:S-layer homology domain-containing protein n=1 Tax=Bacillus sp. 3255 TaxID=2817904 RepID=UPI002864CB9E|nr:S-layer homology domain-containing protein [Bacillus sp. 3255]MDR6880905.1 hypothetical protein [Bacillus sp. 3255]